jgi:hypothetical protein
MSSLPEMAVVPTAAVEALKEYRGFFEAAAAYRRLEGREASELEAGKIANAALYCGIAAERQTIGELRSIRDTFEVLASLGEFGTSGTLLVIVLDEVLAGRVPKPHWHR